MSIWWKTDPIRGHREYNCPLLVCGWYTKIDSVIEAEWAEGWTSQKLEKNDGGNRKQDHKENRDALVQASIRMQIGGLSHSSESLSST